MEEEEEEEDKISLLRQEKVSLLHHYAREMVELLFDDTGYLGRYDLFTLPHLLYRPFPLFPIVSRPDWIDQLMHTLASAFPVLSSNRLRLFRVESANVMIDVMRIVCLVVYGTHKEVKFDVESEKLLREKLQKRFSERQVELLSILGVNLALDMSHGSLTTVEGLVAGFQEVEGPTTLLERLTGGTKTLTKRPTFTLPQEDDIISFQISIFEYAREMVKLLFDDTEYLGGYDLFALPKLLFEFQSNRLVDPSFCLRFMWMLISRNGNWIINQIACTLADAFPGLISDELPRLDAVGKVQTVIDVMLIICLVIYSMHKEVEFDAKSEELLRIAIQKGLTKRQVELLSILGVSSTVLMSCSSLSAMEGLVAGFPGGGGSATLLERLTGSTKKHETPLPLPGNLLKLEVIIGSTKRRDGKCSRKKEKEEAVVGFNDEFTMLLDQLTGSLLKLHVISIVGMPGIGKTTLAKKLYMDPLVEYHFYVRAWTCVSQEYVKRVLLLDILSCFTQLSDKIYGMKDEQLGEKLYRCLKGQRYLVVFDDMWDTGAWDDLRMYFPDDRNGSRILITGRERYPDLGPQACALSHILRLRTEDESWEIFQNELCKDSPHVMHEDIGKQITSKCQGLPLAIVTSVGLVRNKTTRCSWKHIALSLNEYMFRGPNRYMNAVALSYNHLPPQLRPCFLYLGVFPEDCEVPVKKLTWLWIAEGYVRHSVGGKTLEEVAGGYLAELLDRSLVMVAKRGSGGGVRTCRIHDLLRDLCLRKAKELNTSPTAIERFGRFPPGYSSTNADQLHDASSAPFIQPLHSLLCFPNDLGTLIQHGQSINYETYNFLRALDIESIRISSFPSEVVLLIQLRYLAVQARDGNPPTSISNLVHLQFLIISSRKNIVVPGSTWTLQSLRHLCVRSGENVIEEPCLIGESTNTLHSLQTISQVCPSPSCRSIFARTPKLRKLGFCGPLVSSTGDFKFPAIHRLGCLENLKLLNTQTYRLGLKSYDPNMFPESLRKLTLSNTSLHWDELWKVGLLPNLEVLKLKWNACIGQLWETSDVGFPQLKYLKLQNLEIVHWRASSCHLPRLQTLLLESCSKLEEIPLTLGEISTLELISVSRCSAFATNSARKIQELEESNGNEFLKVITDTRHDLPLDEDLVYPRHMEDNRLSVI